MAQLASALPRRAGPGKLAGSLNVTTGFEIAFLKDIPDSHNQFRYPIETRIRSSTGSCSELLHSEVFDELPRLHRQLVQMAGGHGEMTQRPGISQLGDPDRHRLAAPERSGF